MTAVEEIVAPFWVTSCVPLLGIAAGFVAARAVAPSHLRLKLLFHAAAGVVTGVVMIEIAPQLVDPTLRLAILGAFLVGALAFLLVDAATDQIRALHGQTGSDRHLSLVAATLADLLLDGIMIGAAQAVSPSLALRLAIMIAVLDTPILFALASALRSGDASTRFRALVTLASALAAVAGAWLGVWFLASAGRTWQLAAIAVNGGLLLMMAVESLVPEAHKAPDPRHAGAFFIAGFALVGAVAILLP